MIHSQIFTVKNEFIEPVFEVHNIERRFLKTHTGVFKMGFTIASVLFSICDRIEK